MRRLRGLLSFVIEARHRIIVMGGLSISIYCRVCSRKATNLTRMTRSLAFPCRAGYEIFALLAGKKFAESRVARPWLNLKSNFKGHDRIWCFRKHKPEPPRMSCCQSLPKTVFDFIYLQFHSNQLQFWVCWKFRLILSLHRTWLEPIEIGANYIKSNFLIFNILIWLMRREWMN